MENKIRNVNEVAVFEDTVKRSLNTYKAQTQSLIKNTMVYTDLIDSVKFRKNKKMEVSVVIDGTVSAGKKCVEQYGGITAILNFADALVPGGLVLVGATTQEENICRCSNLYQSLTSDIPKKHYYDANNELDFGRKTNKSIYLDNLIYSPSVLFFKDDVTYKKVKPYYMDVITCPSPSTWIKPVKKEYEIIGRRTEQIVKSAILNGVTNLVLGAWGCGAFMQDPKVVSECFKNAIEKYGAFDHVIFAIRGCSADSYGRNNNNYNAFCKTFGEVK